MLEELLEKYDLFHSSLICGGKIKFNINFLPNSKIFVSLVLTQGDNEEKYNFDMTYDEDFDNYYLPKIFQRFLSKNVKTNIRKIMGNNDNGTLVLQRNDLKDCIVIRNCSTKFMDLAELFQKCYEYISNEKKDSLIIFNEEYAEYDNYIKFNVLFDYSTYKSKLYNNENGEIDQDDLLILNIARFAYNFENLTEEEIWSTVKNEYKNNKIISNICDDFKNTKFNEKSVYTNALILAEFEKNNDALINYNKKIIDEALKAYKNGVKFLKKEYIDYWKKEINKYRKKPDNEKEAICIDFVDATYLHKDKEQIVKEGIISKLKKIKGDKEKIMIEEKTKDVSDEVDNIFSSLDMKQIRKDADEYAKILLKHQNEYEGVIKNAQEEANRLFSVSVDNEELKSAAFEYAQAILKQEQEYRELIDAAQEQAKMIINLQNEAEILHESSENYAKTIIKNEQEYRELLKNADIQAQKILELEQQNEELKKLAEENAKYIMSREDILKEEIGPRSEVNNTPIKSQDIDKINNLLYAISCVKDLDYATNHPTIIQALTTLEEKTITYLSTHKNIVEEENIVIPMEKEEMYETKPVIELLSMIRNAYSSSHNFEKDGRHTVINFNSVDDDTYRLSMYSCLGDSEDLLMDVFFEENQLTDNVIKELCDIYKNNSVIIASKTDNIPPNKADYLVIDNMNNAFRFINCKRNFIEKVKEYI